MCGNPRCLAAYEAMVVCCCRSLMGVYIPIGSMYGIHANIGGILMVNVTIYSIHPMRYFISLYLKHRGDFFVG